MGFFDALGSLGGVFGIGSTYMTNQANKKSAEAQMNFQRGMSDTAHQREVADLKAAGLNPILSASHGGSSTPMGAMARMEAPDVGAAVNTSKSAMAMSQELKNLKLQGDSIMADYYVKDASFKKIDAERRNLDTDNIMKKLMIPGLANTAAVDSGQLGEAMSYVDRISKSFGNVMSGFSSAKDVIRPLSPRYQKLNSFDTKTGEIFK